MLQLALQQYCPVPQTLVPQLIPLVVPPAPIAVPPLECELAPPGFAPPPVATIPAPPPLPPGLGDAPAQAKLMESDDIVAKAML